jgi:hypothetical protein
MNTPDPVIPNLQYLSANCSSVDCQVKLHLHREEKRHFLYRDKVTAFDVFFHDCVKIIPPNQRQHYPYFSPDATHWHSQNSTSLAALLIGFFEYYGKFDVNNEIVAFTPRSQRNGTNKHRNDVLIVYDPFVEDRNVA